MENISYHKATPDDIETLVEYRTRFAIELKGERPLEEINNLKKQMTNYFAKATADNTWFCSHSRNAR